MKDSEISALKSYKAKNLQRIVTLLQRTVCERTPFIKKLFHFSSVIQKDALSYLNKKIWQ